MRILHYISLIVLMPVYCLACPRDSTVAVMSFNIRMNYQDDGPNNWPDRAGWITDMVHHYDPGLLGAEECYYPQYKDLRERLTDYNAFGPSEGWQGAESVAIFYKKDRYELLDSGTFWLSQTPDQQSVGWDASLRRTVTWGSFRVKASSQRVFFFVTHFDHKGDVAREESAKLLLKKVQEIAGGSTAFIAGDFNLGPQSRYYKILTAGTESLPRLYDAHTLAARPYGPSWTVNAFGKVPAEKRIKIDYIFCNKPLPVKSYVNIAEQRGEVFLSDHNPQLAVVVVK